MSNQAATDLLRSQLARRSPDAVAGWKVALNFAGPQKLLGITHSLAAPLDVLHTYQDGGRLEVASDRRIHVEAELALRLADEVLEPADVRIASFTPCLELVDYALPRNGLAAMFEHSFFHAGIVLGSERQEFTPLADGLPRAQSSTGKVHARLPGTVPDDVREALVALCERVLESGGSLRRGQLVLCGSYIEPIALDPGATVQVDFGPALGSLTISR